MRSDAIRQWVEIVANIGVFVGIVFLAAELNQNTVSQRMNAKLSIAERFAEFDGSVAANAQLAELLDRAEVQGAELTGAEFRQYLHHYYQWLGILMRAESLHAEGVLSEDDWKHYACEARKMYATVNAFRRAVDTARLQYLTEGIYDALTKPSLCGA